MFEVISLGSRKLKLGYFPQIPLLCGNFSSVFRNARGGGG